MITSPGLGWVGPRTCASLWRPNDRVDLVSPGAAHRSPGPIQFLKPRVGSATPPHHRWPPIGPVPPRISTPGLQRRGTALNATMIKSRLACKEILKREEDINRGDINHLLI